MSSCARRSFIVLAALLGAAACSGTTDTATTGTSTASSSSSGSGSSGGGTSGGTTTGSATTGGDTFTNWASPGFFKLYCVSCHSAGGQGDPSGSNLDWTSYPDVQLNANDIRCGVALAQDPSWNCPNSISAKQFPIGDGPKPSDVDRIRLVGWIDAGTPQ
jgi:hypothetical protein